MGNTKTAQGHPQPSPAPVESAVLPDVVTPPQPGVGDPLTPPASEPEAGAEQLQDVLPEITEVARKVGGFRKLADLARELDHQAP